MNLPRTFFAVVGASSAVFLVACSGPGAPVQPASEPAKEVEASAPRAPIVDRFSFANFDEVRVSHLDLNLFYVSLSSSQTLDLSLELSNSQTLELSNSQTLS